MYLTLPSDLRRHYRLSVLKLQTVFFQNQDFHRTACFRRILREQVGVSSIASELCLENVPLKPRPGTLSTITEIQFLGDNAGIVT
jgi:hypothetical protein